MLQRWQDQIRRRGTNRTYKCGAAAPLSPGAPRVNHPQSSPALVLKAAQQRTHSKALRALLAGRCLVFSTTHENVENTSGLS